MIDELRTECHPGHAQLKRARPDGCAGKSSGHCLFAGVTPSMLTTWRCLLGSIGFLVFICVASIVRADEGLDEYNLALSLFGQGRWKLATQQFRDFLAKYEDHDKAASGRFYLGISLGKLNDFKESRSELVKFSDKNRKHPKYPEARYRIGECSYLLEDLERAQNELQGFVEDFPKDPMCEYALTYLGDTLMRLKKPDAAVKTFDRAVEEFPSGKKIDDAKFGRAKSLEMLQKYDAAIEQYKELASKKDGERAADAQLNIGDSYFERKQPAQAIAAYEEFVKNFSDSSLLPTVRLHLGYANFQSAKFQDAAKQFDQLLQDPVQGKTASLWLARSWKSQGDYAKALKVLSAVSVEGDKSPLAESLLYERAICERYSQHPEPAHQLFTELIKQFPTGDLADDSLHALAEMDIESGDLKAAEQMIGRFRKDFPQSGLKLHFDMLEGRLDLAQAGVKRSEDRPAEEIRSTYEAAAKKFDEVMNQSSNARTKRLARYYLALCRQFQNDLDRALELLAPLVEQAVQDGARSDFVDAIVMQADCQFQLQKYDLASKSAAQYLELIPSGRKVASALRIQALSADKQNELKVAETAADRLVQEYATSPLTVVTVQQLAEAAEGREDWNASRRWYETLSRIQTDPEKRAYALRGIAAAQYASEEFEAAAESYKKIVDEFPQQALAVECAYFQADALRKAKQDDQALTVYRKLFDSMPDKKVAAGAEAKPPLEFYYKAGQWIAILLSNAQKVDEADAAYEALLKRFPNPADLEKRLYQWASLNHDHERYEQADAIWKRLIAEFPESPFANEAKLHLAESDFDAGHLEAAHDTFQAVADDARSSSEIKEWALYKLVAMAVEKQQWDEVRKISERLANDFPQSPKRYYALYSQVEALMSVPKPSEKDMVMAQQILDQLKPLASNEEVSKSEWFDRLWVLQAELSLAEKKYDEVETTVEELKRRNPRSRFLYQAEEVLGRAYKQQAPPRFADARAAFERAIANEVGRHTETAAKAQFLIGDTYVFQENWQNAFVAFQKVYSLYKYPEWQASALLMSARCDEKQGEWKPAVETYKRILDEFPKFSRIDDVKAGLQAAQKRAGG